MLCDKRCVERVLCDGVKWRECCVMGGVWKVLCGGMYVERVLSDGRNVKRV